MKKETTEGQKRLQEKLVGKIKKEFPKLKWKIFRYEHGWDHDVIILDEKIVFRFPKDNDRKKKLIREIALLEYLDKKIKMPIPKYEWVAKGNIFAGYKMIRGEALRPGTKTVNRKKIIDQIADFFTCIHKLPLADLEKLNVRNKNAASILRGLVKAVETQFSKKLPPNDIQNIRKFLPILKDVFENYPNKVLVHGDVSESNILIANNCVAGIIDFSDGGIFDPAMDFSRIWEFGPGFVRKVYEGYRGKKDSKFLERSKIYYRMTALWVLMGACRNYPIKFEKGYKMFKERFYL